MRLRLLLATALMMLVAACGGSSRAATPTTVVITLPPTTSSSTTSASTGASTPPTTLAATTTSVDPKLEAERLARDAVDRFEAAFATCIRDLATCDTKAFADVAADQLLTRTVDYVERAKAEGEVVRDAENHRYVIESAVASVPPDQVTVRSCNFDARRLVRPAAAPDGTDIVVDDSAQTSRFDNDVRQSADGRWRLVGATRVGADAKGDQCAAQ